METLKLTLSTPQSEAFLSKSRETFFIGGVGSGKTFLLALLISRAMATPGTVCGLYSPTRKVLKNATWRQVETAFSDCLGIEQNLHYVVNKQPPRSWGIKPFSTVKNDNVVTFRWGSYLLLDGLDDPDSQRGQQLDEIFVDEFRDVKENARLVLGGRLRGDTYKKLGKKHRIWYATTPPDNVAYLRELREKEDGVKINMVFSPTAANARNLPAGYIEGLRDQYDDITYQREVMGELVDMRNRPFAYAFDVAKHTGQVHFNQNLPIYLSFDFNINPATAIACQHAESGIRVLKEWRLANTDLITLCNHIKAWLPTRLLYVTGDASGQNRHFLSGNKTAYVEISRIFQIPTKQVLVAKSNPSISSSSILTNSVFTHTPVTIDTSCTHLIKDLQFVQVLDDGGIDKSKLEMGHLLDCFRYYVHTFHLNTLKRQPK